MMTRACMIVLAAFVVALGPSSDAQQARSASNGDAGLAPGVTVLLPTNHPPLSRNLSDLWLAPGRGSAAKPSPSTAALAAAIRLYADGEDTKVLGLVSESSLQDGPLRQYAIYYSGLAQLRLKRPDEARKTFQSLLNQKPVGYLSEAAALAEADALETLNDPRAAVDIYERLLKGKVSALDVVLMRLGKAAQLAGDPQKSAEAYARVYYELALSDLAPAAGVELAMLPSLQAIAPGTQRFKLELGRAERLFGARQYSAARAAFSTLRGAASGDERELVDLRLAEAEYFLKQPRNARDGVRPYLTSGSRQGEALFFYAIAQRDLGNIPEYLQSVRRVVDEFPDQTWGEEALNNLATYFIIKDQDDDADAALRELYARNPRGPYAERAAWKVGWRAYREGRYQETIQYFERAASDFPRSDYRPPWLYWSARAHEQLNETAVAENRYALVTADYLNSYYGRLVTKRLGGKAPAARAVVVPVADAEEGPPAAKLPGNTPIVRALLDAGLYDDALKELRYAQRVGGDAPAIQATIAWVHQQQARSESGSKRFQLLRGAMNTMRRAYPQFMAAGGEDLPRDVLSVIYPIAYWDLIRRYSAQNDLDPFFVAALVAQESTFVADIRSHANAYGLMQLMPSTARQYARRLNLRYSSRLLTDPEANIRMGTAYLADKIREFGDVHLVLASYNAGETPVRRWMAERPGIDRDEFIDDIPYPETQGYVKKIIGTADDYRHLYGGESRVEGIDTTAKPATPSRVEPPRKAPVKRAPAKKPLPKRPRK